MTCRSMAVACGATRLAGCRKRPGCSYRAAGDSTNSVLATLTVPLESGFAEERLLRSQRDIYRSEWPGGGIEYHPSHGRVGTHPPLERLRP